MRVVRRRIELQSRSNADRMYLWREYFLERDKLGRSSGYRISDAGVGPSSIETPTPAGGGLRSAHRHESDMSVNAVQAPLQQSQTGLSHQDEMMGRLDHEGLSANFGVGASSIPDVHLSSMASMPALPDHELSPWLDSRDVGVEELWGGLKRWGATILLCALAQSSPPQSPANRQEVRVARVVVLAE